MNSKDFKDAFSEKAVHHGFEKAHGGWFKDSKECIVVLDLQKSNYGNYYELNKKIYIQGMFGATHTKSKDLVKKNSGDVFRRQPNKYQDIFNLENHIDDSGRAALLNDFFLEFVLPFTNTSLSRDGLLQLAEKKEIVLMPAISEGLSVH